MENGAFSRIKRRKWRKVMHRDRRAVRPPANNYNRRMCLQQTRSTIAPDSNQPISFYVLYTVSFCASRLISEECQHSYFDELFFNKTDH